VLPVPHRPSGCTGSDFGSTWPCGQRPRAPSLCRCSATRFMSVPLGRPPPSCAPGRFVLGQTRSGLGVWVASPRGSGASKAAGISSLLATAQRRRLGAGEARRRPTDFYPPGC
jgi:hypothetical protein